MKRLSFAALFGLLALVTVCLAPGRANAQQNNCDALSRTPFMCLENHSSFSIVAVQASSAATYGTNWISIPGGAIPPGGMSIIKFPVWGPNDCNKFVIVRTATGAVHPFPGVNVCSSTKFAIAGW